MNKIIRKFMAKFMPKTLKVYEMNKLYDLYQNNKQYLSNPIGGMYDKEQFELAIKIVEESILFERFYAECDLTVGL